MFPFRVLWPSWEYPAARDAYARATADRRNARGSCRSNALDSPLLMFSGTDDRMWPSDVFAEHIAARLREHGHVHIVEHQRYEGAGHLFGVPFSASITARRGRTFTGAAWAAASKPTASWWPIRGDAPL
ncbi:hypothetical protein BH23ACT10_BH23ACT10_20920 [soil metagenome]